MSEAAAAQGAAQGAAAAAQGPRKARARAPSRGGRGGGGGGKAGKMACAKCRKQLSPPAALNARLQRALYLRDNARPVRDDFILVSPDNEAQQPEDAEASARLQRVDLDYFAAACKRELLALALVGGGENATDQVDSVLVCPRVATSQELGRQARNDARASASAQSAPSLCEDCVNFCQAALRREALESAETLLKIRAFDRERAHAAQVQAYGAGAGVTPGSGAGSGASAAGAGTSSLAEDTPRDGGGLADEVASLLREQNKLMSEINEIESARAGIRQEQAKLDAEAAALTAQEREFWSEFGSLNELLHVVSEKTDSLKSRINRTMSVLWLLSPIHAFNDAFFIWRDGDYGTINGFRLGQLVGPASHQSGPGSTRGANKPPPDWEEINTAWGLSAMLLSAIAHVCATELTGFKIEFMGARTTIRIHGTAPSPMSFFASGSYPLYLDVGKSSSMLDKLKVVGGATAVDNFNHAMRAFLICLKQLCDQAMNTETGVSLDIAQKMYEIDVPDVTARRRGIPPRTCVINGNLVDMMHSPVYGPGTVPPEADIDRGNVWTKAMRHVLTNLKWLLVWCVHHKGASVKRFDD